MYDVYIYIFISGRVCLIDFYLFVSYNQEYKIERSSLCQRDGVWWSKTGAALSLSLSASTYS